MAGPLYYDDPKGYNKKVRLGQRLQPFVLPISLLLITGLGWRCHSLHKQLTNVNGKLDVTKLQLDQSKREGDGWQRVSTSKDNTISTLQRNVDRINKELAGERRASQSERDAAKRCRDEYHTLNEKVLSLEHELADERNLRHAGTADVEVLRRRLDTALTDADRYQRLMGEAEKRAQDEKAYSGVKERENIARRYELEQRVQALEAELASLPCRPAAGGAAAAGAGGAVPAGGAGVARTTLEGPTSNGYDAAYQQQQQQQQHNMGHQQAGTIGTTAGAGGGATQQQQAGAGAGGAVAGGTGGWQVTQPQQQQQGVAGGATQQAGAGQAASGQGASGQAATGQAQQQQQQYDNYRVHDHYDGWGGAAGLSEDDYRHMLHDYDWHDWDRHTGTSAPPGSNTAGQQQQQQHEQAAADTHADRKTLQ